MSPNCLIRRRSSVSSELYGADHHWLCQFRRMVHLEEAHHRLEEPKRVTHLLDTFRLLWAVVRLLQADQAPELAQPVVVSTVKF